jgi:malate dehydrogenase
MAYAGARFVNSLLEASVLKKAGVKECTYVKSEAAAAHGIDYFSTVVELGVWFAKLSPSSNTIEKLIASNEQVAGVEKIHPIPALNDFEQKLLAAAVPELKTSIQKGVEFANKTTSAL